MKKIILSVFCISSLINAAHYKSTEEVTHDISNTFYPITQSDNLFRYPHLLLELRELGVKVNNYILSKQGIILGKESQQTYAQSDNIFDVWAKELYPRFLSLVDILQNIKIKKTDSNIGQIKVWVDAKTFFTEVVSKAQKIRKNTIVDQKKKLANIIILFTDYVIDINKKALKDTEMYK